MKKIKKMWCLLNCIFFIILCETESYAKEAENENEAGTLYAQSAVLMDGSSGRILYEKNGEIFLANASTTKILTCILALENAQLTDIVNVSSYAASMPDVQLHIKEGEQYYLGDLLYSLMLESHNDVAVAIAEHISGNQEEFSRLMNRKAKEIGCKNTTFLTPNGLDATQKAEIEISENQIAEKLNSDKLNEEEDEVFSNINTLPENENAKQEMQIKEISHGTTAADLALIMRYCIKLSPRKEQFLQITQTPAYSFSNIEGTRNFYCRNHNAFLNMMEGAVSGKTGFTGKAGYCYVGALEREGRSYIVALLACGWPDNKTYKWSDCKKLMNYGLDEYELFSLEQLELSYENQLTSSVNGAKRGQISEEAAVELSRKPNPVSEILLREDEVITVQITKNELEAPVQIGQQAGKITYYINNEKWMEEELLCAGGIEKIDYGWCLEQVAGKLFN